LHAAKQDRPDWPNVGFDFGPPMERITSTLTAQLPGFTFLPTLANGPEEAQRILAQNDSSSIDGYLVYQMNCWNRVVQSVADTGKPTLYADFQYGGSGGFLVYTAGFLRKNTANLGFVAASDLSDLVAATKCFELHREADNTLSFADLTAQIRRKNTPAPHESSCLPDKLDCLAPEECVRSLKVAKILAVGGAWPGIAPDISEGMGIEVVNVPFDEVNQAWEKADKENAAAIADRWESAAAKVEDVDRATLETSAAMYLAQKEVLKKHDANAITINCLGGFYGGHIHAYPCLGFHELLNEGLIGACECDVRSTASMVAITALTQGRPGYISDPVIDTSARQIIYAHCVASNRVFGPQGKANPFQILTHSEDRQGASVRSVMPLGYMTTSFEVAPERRTILLHKGKAVANIDDDRACRTKLAVEPEGDIEKLFREWDQWGWHRVTVYGDLKEPISGLADALGWTVLEEA
jgi:L-fucose isomerase-like protein